MPTAGFFCKAVVVYFKLVDTTVCGIGHRCLRITMKDHLLLAYACQSANAALGAGCFRNVASIACITLVLEPHYKDTSRSE